MCGVFWVNCQSLKRRGMTIEPFVLAAIVDVSSSISSASRSAPTVRGGLGGSISARTTVSALMVRRAGGGTPGAMGNVNERAVEHCEHLTERTARMPDRNTSG